MTNTLKFRDLRIGQTFDFVNDAEPGYNSFFERCTKVSATSYTWYSALTKRTLKSRASINAEVYHVDEDK